jgi:L-amino acid N-acyltransferase YncA
MASQEVLREAARPFPAELADRAGDVDPNGTPQTSAPLARRQVAGIAVAKSEADFPALEDWVQRIVDLHAAGDLPAAAQELQALRRAYPDADARLPTGLRAWATTVGPDGEP